MKRFIFMFSLMLSMALSASAQTAVETSKWYDNVSVGVTAGVATPLSFNSMFPLNTLAGIRLQKDFTPVIGLQAEGLAILNSNNNTFVSPAKTTVKAVNVGLNGVINLTNAFMGYNGTPRTFEISTVTGLGFMHEWETKANFLTAKTGLDLAFNLGSKKAHSIVITPAVFWNLNKLSGIKFNKNLSQLAITATYVYHFKTSNGTHAFKVWDVGQLNDDINVLRAKNQSLVDENEALLKVIKELKNQPKQTAAVVAQAPETKIVQAEWVVFFSQNSAELTDEAKAVLDTVEGTVTVVATASPEGPEKFNQTVSDKRAQAVADFLTNKGVTVKSVKGLGVQGKASNRVAIVKNAD